MISERNGEQPAGPTTVRGAGLSKREHIAAILMGGLLSNASLHAPKAQSPMATAQSAVDYADALLQALEIKR